LPAAGIDGWRRLLARVSAGKEVSIMKTYEVYVLVPKLELFEAEDEADLFAQVGELYRKLYRHQARALIDLLPEQEDVT
jgi:hypothetical protein